MTNEQQTQRFTINRIEEGLAILEKENNQTFEVPEAWLPAGASAGDVLLLRCRNQKLDSGLHFFIDLQSRKARQEEVEAMMQALLRDAEEDAEAQARVRTERK